MNSKDNKISSTYCNPLPIPDCPRGNDVDPWHVMSYTGDPKTDYRSVSDPSVLYDNGKWYLYPSYGMAFVSENFKDWKHVRTNPYNMKYSPTVVPFRGKYLMTSHSNGLYISDSPLGDFEFLGNFIKLDGSEFCPVDPGLFVDDDGRLYLYFFDYAESKEHRRVFTSGSYGVELDGDDPRKLKTDFIKIHEFNPENKWERFGEKNQDTLCGWIEGQYMIKKNGRYYLIYATTGTEYSNYSMAAYYSDESPLFGFKPQKNNPFTISHSKLISGAGHGCVTEGPNDTLWAFYTISVAYTHIYERLVGMDLIDINEDGELYAPHGITDTPQFAPGVSADPVKENSANLYALTARQRGWTKVSSKKEGREPFYALDESLQTFWQPDDADPTPSITVNLQAPYMVSAMRLIVRSVGLDYDNGILPGAFKYILEGQPNMDIDEWVTLIDCRDNETDYNVDYRTFEPTSCEAVRLTITECPKGIRPGVSDFTVFGIRDESV